ncbi:Phosphatase [Hartmannibacter diazotrophicus]|uniref:Phosphatase n=1 Tax=Hartmannibacter diazotrophicus TaxID=1482074 RepID=A0A2C9D4F2_9HYPH|nr:HAD family phosphatase [Hartmannibacter diazotrophicus]SON54651.1 Phosphatase [Hartmannibacter diazotrophicus]
MIRLVVFDVDGVLYHYDIEARLAHLSGTTGIDPDEIHARVWRSGFEDAADAGRYSDPDAYLQGFSEALGAPLSKADWIAARKASVTPIPESLNVVRRVAGRCAIAAFTNNGPLLKAEIANISPEMTVLFPGTFFTSAEFGVAKPDPLVYHRLADRCGLPPGSIYFIDDKPENVDGALAAGYGGGHVFHTAGGMAGAIRAAGISLD